MSDNIKISADGIKQIDNYIEKLSSKMTIPESEQTAFKEELRSNLIFSVEELLAQEMTEEYALKTVFNRFGNADILEPDIRKTNWDVRNMSNSAKLIGKTISLVLAILMVGMLIFKSKYTVIVVLLTIIFCTIFMYKDKKIKF